jgi:hypothetical protein
MKAGGYPKPPPRGSSSLGQLTPAQLDKTGTVTMTIFPLMGKAGRKRAAFAEPPQEELVDYL